MTDTNKHGDIPDHIWAWKEDCGDVWTGEWSPDREAYHVPHDAVKMISADRASAQTAAAVMQMREDAAKAANDQAEAYRTMERQAWECGRTERWEMMRHSAEGAERIATAVRALPLPDTTALDALIAERVREARAYAREAIIHASNNLSAHLEQYHDHEEETPERSNLRGIMHHLEGTLMGMDDAEAEAARASKEGR